MVANAEVLTGATGANHTRAAKLGSHSEYERNFW